ncbi:extracellular cyanophycinase [Pelomyxa schiedti]|nr:extracellular cyanophycinase [Pelomyxa schiedti]
MFVLALFSFVSLMSASSAATARGVSQNLIMVGGALDDYNSQIYSKFVELSGGLGSRVGVIPAASDDPVSSAEYYVDLLRNTWGLDPYWIMVDEAHLDNASNPEVVELANSMSGFYFSGGDQARVTASFLFPNGTDTPVMAAIRAKYNAGAVVLGSSAGTACQTSYPMVDGGESYEALIYGTFDTCDIDPSYLCVDGFGLGLFTWGYLDTHFSDRGREGRLMRLISDVTPSGSALRGYGCDQNTALLVSASDEVATATVIGSEGVLIVDMTGAMVIKDPDTGMWSAHGITTSYLTEDDTVDLITGKVISFAPGKRALKGREHTTNAVTSSDIFNVVRGERNLEYVNVATSLFDASASQSTYGTTVQKKPEYTVFFTKAPDGAGYDGVTSFDVYVISYTGCIVDVYPTE